MGFDFPLTLIQLLWVNLVMDTLAALAFGGEPPLERYMSEKPVDRNEAIISPYMWSSISCNGIFMAILSVIWLTWPPIMIYFERDGVIDREAFLTGFFCFFIFITAMNAFNVRTTRLNLGENMFENRNFVFVVGFIFIVQILFTYIGGEWLRTVGLSVEEWCLVLFFSSFIIPFDLLRKKFVVPQLRKRIEEGQRRERTRLLVDLV